MNTPNQSKFKGFIFDFNGVLLWDKELQEQSWKDFSEKIRGNPMTGEELAIHMHGRNNGAVLEYLLGRPVEGEELHILTQQKESLYRQLCLVNTERFKLSPGAIALLDYLVTHNIPHTIATASEKTNVDFFIQHLYLNRWFDITQVVYDDGTFQGKPAPDIYLRAAKNLGLSPAVCVVTEDSRSGIQAAYAAGIGHIIALGPKDTHTVLTRLTGVNQVIENLGQVAKENFF
ncbi:MAG: HAD family phosphatase [Anaerolineae bacterium]|nr:HAD family phosphatase [Anaerolineae bacterium]